MNTIIAVLILELALFSTAQDTHDPNYCYAYDASRPQQRRWSDRTSNEYIRGPSIETNVSSCTPAKFWLYMRHGDRLPSTSDINLMVPFSMTVSIFYKFIIIKKN